MTGRFGQTIGWLCAALAVLATWTAISWHGSDIEVSLATVAFLFYFGARGIRYVQTGDFTLI
jgi:hypothetical protein